MSPITNLKTASTLSNKQILLNPAKHFSDYQAADIVTLNAVKKLCQQRLSLEEQQKALRNKAGILSRQIGEAKRNKQATNTLISTMQDASAEGKAIAVQIKQLNQNILNHFAQEPAVTNQKNTELDINANPQRYKTTNTDVVHIQLFTATDNLQEWNDYVDSNAAACIHHRAEWRTILLQSYGHEAHYLCARDANQRMVGILPLILIKSRLFGNKLVSMPFFQRGGALADSPFIEQELMQAAATYGLQAKLDYVEFRDDTRHQHLPVLAATQTHKVNMVLALPETQQTLWQSFSAKLRAQINRPQREKPAIFIGKKEHLNDFYAVYSRNMRDLGSPVQSKLFIANILSHFPHNSWLIVIKLHQRPVAAGFLLGFGNTLEIPLASTLRKVNPLSMNMLLYWEILKFAITQNYSQFDFGRSSKNAGTYRFKQQWGAKPKQLYWHYCLEESKIPPSLNPANPKYALIIKLWKRLPVALANVLGPAIVKNIP